MHIQLHCLTIKKNHILHFNKLKGRTSKCNYILIKYSCLCIQEDLEIQVEGGSLIYFQGKETYLHVPEGSC
jgi:hypothetical protein